MNSRQLLASAAALALPVWTLCAQDNPPPRPPEAPQRDGAAQRDGGPRPGGPGAPDSRYRGGAGGFFGAFDTNHDGSIDADELSHASDSLRKLDRNGDGKLTPDEFRPQGGQGDDRGRRPDGRPEGRPDAAPGQNPGRPGFERGSRPDGDRPGRPDGEARGPQDRGEARGPQGRGEGRPPQDRGEARPEVRGPQDRPEGRGPQDRDLRADGRREQRPEFSRGEGERHPGPGPDARPEGRREGPGQFDGPRRDGGAPQLPPRPPGDDRREGRDAQPPRDGGAQAWHHFHHHPRFAPGGPESGPGFADRGPRRDDFRPSFPPPWAQRPQGGERRVPDQYAAAPRFHEFRSWSAPDFRDEYRRDARGPSQWEGRREYREYRDFQAPPQRGSDRDRMDDQRRDGGPRDRQFGPGPRGFDRGDFRSRPPESRPDAERSLERPVRPPQGFEHHRFERPPQDTPIRQGAEETREEVPTPV